MVGWIASELEFYVKDYISDSDYEFLLNNLIDIAEAHAYQCVKAFHAA